MRITNQGLHRAAVADAACSLALSTGSAAAGSAAFNQPADVAAITDIEHKLAKLNTMKDLIQYYAPDAMVLDMYAPGIYRGTKQIYDGFEQQFAQGQSFTGAIADMNIMSDGNFGCAFNQDLFTF